MSPVGCCIFKVFNIIGFSKINLFTTHNLYPTLAKLKRSGLWNMRVKVELECICHTLIMPQHWATEN